MLGSKKRILYLFYLRILQRPARNRLGVCYIKIIKYIVREAYYCNREIEEIHNCWKVKNKEQFSL